MYEVVISIYVLAWNAKLTMHALCSIYTIHEGLRFCTFRVCIKVAGALLMFEVLRCGDDHDAAYEFEQKSSQYGMFHLFRLVSMWLALKTSYMIQKAY